jgi:signal transduction histidine kinase
MQQDKFNIFILLIIWLLLLQSSSGQKTKDPLILRNTEFQDTQFVLMELGLSKPASGNEFVLPEEIREKLSNADDSTKIYIYLNLAGNFLSTSLAQSMSFANIAYDISSKHNWLWGLAEAENSLGNVYYYLTDYITAQSYYFKSREKRILLNDSVGIAGSNNNLSLIYYDLKNYKKAIDLNFEALSIYKKKGTTHGMADSYNNLTLIYQQMNDLQNSLKYSDFALFYYKKVKDTNGIAIVYNNLGDFYTKRNELKKASQFLRQSLSLYQSIQDLPGIATAKLNLGIVYLQKNKLDESFPYLRDALKLSEQLQLKELVSEAHKYYSEYYKKKGDYKNALLQYKTYTIYMDSIFAENTSNIINEKRVAFESENQKKKIQILKKDQEYSQLRIQKQKYLGIFLIILAGIAFSIILLTNIVFQMKSETSRLIKEKNIELFYTNKILAQSKDELRRLNQAKNRFLSIIAHDLISPFGAFIQLSRILVEKIDSLNENEIKEYSELIYKSASNIFNLIDNLLQWSRAQSGKLNYNPELLTLANIFNSVIQIYKPLADKKNIKIISNIEEYLKAYADPDILSTVLRNLLSNAIKFTPDNGIITLAAKTSGKMIEVYISDTGVGMDKKEINKLFQLDNNFSKQGTNGETGNGLGLILCKEFVEILGGTIGVQSSKNAGSTFWFSIPGIPSPFQTKKL